MRRYAAIATPGFLVAIGVLIAFRGLAIYPWNEWVFDLHAYWATRSGVDYAAVHAGPAGTYLYSPAFAQLILPLTSLPLPVFAAIWTAIGVVLLLWLGGRHAPLLAILPPVALTLVQGQLDLAFAAVAVVGLRWPAVWALPLLTKVTPGVGLVWFLVRREWRSLAIAVGATLGLVALSVAIDPSAWISWVGLLQRNQFNGDGLLYIPIGLVYRLPVAIAVVAWGGLTNRSWTIPIAVCLGMPILWLNSPTILVGILPLIAAGATTPAGRWLRRSRISLVAVSERHPELSAAHLDRPLRTADDGG